MKSFIPSLITVVSLAFSAVTPVAFAEEKEETVKLSDVPKAVQKAFQAEAKGGKIVRIEREVENGKTTYEAIIEKKGKRFEVEVSAEGKVLDRENELTGAKEKKS